MSSYTPRRSAQSYRRGDRISDLLLRQGEIDAEGALRSGSIWGNTIGGLGQIASGAIQGHSEEQARQQQMRLMQERQALEEFRYTEQAKREANRDAREEERAAREAAEAERQAKEREAIDAAIAEAERQRRGGAPTPGTAPSVGGAPTAAGVPTAGTGRRRIDYEAIAASLPGHLQTKFRQDLNEANAAGLKFRQVQDDYLGRLALGTIDYLDDPAQAATAVEVALQHAEENGIQGIEQVREQLQADPSSVKRIVMGLITRSPSASAEMRAREPKKHPVTVAGPGGGPMAKLVTEEELEKGVPTYRAPVQGREPDYEWVIRNGKHVQIQKGRAQPGDTPASVRERASTGQEKTALAFYNDAVKAAADVDSVADKVGNGVMLNFAHNAIQTAEQQQYWQGVRAFAEAHLRKRSGATITKDELEKEAKTFFKQPNDSPAVLAQKKASRDRVINGIRIESGRAYDEYYGESAPTPGNETGGFDPSDPLGLRSRGGRGAADPLGIR